MLATTLDIIRSGLKADPSITPGDRNRIIGLLRQSPTASTRETPPPNEPRILRRAEVARRLSRSLRTIDKLSSQGVLPKRTLPGRTRAVGFLEADVFKLLNGSPE